MLKIDYNDILDAINSTNSMRMAAKKLNIKYSTFRRKATKFGLYKPNQGRKGVKREEYENESQTIPLESILNGDFPFYGTHNLKKRLFKSGVKENKCEVCGISEWMGEKIVCELDHIDGDSRNHRLENLRIICPNCHSQTKTYAGRNIKNKKLTKDDFIKAITSSVNFTEAKKKLNISLTGNNNITLKRIMNTYNVEFIKS